MKLYIWKEVLCDYTCGVIFAMAETLEQAQQAAIDGAPDWGQDSVRNVVTSEMPEIHEVAHGLAVWGGG